MLVASFLCLCVLEHPSDLIELGQFGFEVLHKGFVFGTPVLDLLQVFLVHFEIPEHDRLDIDVVLFHYVLVSQLFVDFIDSLCVCVRNLAIFLAVAELDGVAPLHEIEFQVKVQDIQRMEHIDEGEADVAFRLEVHRKIEEVILALEILIQQLKHIILNKLDRNISDHQGCQIVDLFIVILFSSEYPIEVDGIILWSIFYPFVLLELLLQFSLLVPVQFWFRGIFSLRLSRSSCGLVRSLLLGLNLLHQFLMIVYAHLL